MEEHADSDLARLHREYRPALMAFFLRRARNHAEAEDLTQEVFLRIAAGQVAPMQRTDAYIFQTAANLMRDKARRDRVRNDFASGARLVEGAGIDALDPHRMAAGRQDLSRLLRGIDALPERTQQIFMLFRYEHIDQRTIAESFGISVSAVEKHICRAMAQLMVCVRNGE